MQVKTIIVFLIAVLALSCGSTRPTALNKVQTWRIYATNMDSMFEAVRAFARKEDFKLLRFEEEAGRILGHKSLEDSVLKKSRVIMMAMAITQMDSVQCLIDARFNFANEVGEYTPHSQQILSAYYYRLFDYLGELFKLTRI
jgi:hypothetical protein